MDLSWAVSRISVDAGPLAQTDSNLGAEKVVLVRAELVLAVEVRQDSSLRAGMVGPEEGGWVPASASDFGHFWWKEILHALMLASSHTLHKTVAVLKPGTRPASAASHPWS